MADSDDDDELFKFAPFKPTVEQEQNYHNSLLEDINDAEEEAGRSHNSCKRPIPEGLAAQLVSGRTKRRRNPDDDLFDERVESDGDDDGHDIKPVKESADSDTDSDDSDLSLIDGPYGYSDPSPNDYKAMVLMDSIGNTLKRRERNMDFSSDPVLDTSDPVLDTSDSITPDLGVTNVRVRCQGTVHTFQLMKDDVLSVVAVKLSAIYKGSNILLQFQAKDIKQSDTIDSLGLSTVDILDAFPMSKTSSASVGSTTNTAGNKTASDEISIKIQSSRKSSIYSIKEDEPFEKIMKKFADEIDLKLTKIKFTFDGSVVTKRSSPSDHDMEDGDVIDATLT